mgnify:FL=1
MNVLDLMKSKVLCDEFNKKIYHLMQKVDQLLLYGLASAA